MRSAGTSPPAVHLLHQTPHAGLARALSQQHVHTAGSNRCERAAQQASGASSTGASSTGADSQQQAAAPPDAASEFERLQQLLLQYDQAYERGSPEVA
jgi:hypothetical protein